MDVLDQSSADAVIRKFNSDRLRDITHLLESNARPERGQHLKRLHGSQRKYYGLFDPELLQVYKVGYLAHVPLFPVHAKGPLAKTFNWMFQQGFYSYAVEFDIFTKLFYGESFEERWLAIMAFQKFSFGGDERIEMVAKWLGDCEGIADSDLVARWLVAPALSWTKDKWTTAMLAWVQSPAVWQRRAAVVAHIRLLRYGRIHSSFWSIMADLVADYDKPVRQAVGWALRECSAHFATEASEFMRSNRNHIVGIVHKEACRPVLKSKP